MEKKKDKTFDSVEELDDFMSFDEEKDLEQEKEREEKKKPSSGKGKNKDSKKESVKPASGTEKKTVKESSEDITLPEIKEEEKPTDMLDVAADVPIQVVAVMGKKNITIKELASLKMGEVVELGRPANEVVDLVAGGKLIAKGELVEIEGKMGIRIIKMLR